ncbi:protein disulfide isomerase-like 1-4 [Iris pallida]|uniref:protein disulfide-isomerase n=1 Tax=Iris pallida TaxID=29817 RepID=A0AAX6FM65_IRIPA|nr:protein disulfide isomerase-like 1-4 [Iris pallida]
MVNTRSLLLFLLISSLLAFNFVIAASKNHLQQHHDGDGDGDDDDEDLSFLDDEPTPHSDHDDDEGGLDPDEFEGYDDHHDAGEEEEEEDPPAPEVDDKDVVVLTGGNFSHFVSGNKHVMVEFYAPWCGHCQALAPEYAAAATELKEDVALAKVDATDENDLAEKYDVQGFPTIIFFIDGVHIPYPAGRTKDAIVDWIKKKIQPAVQNITTAEEAEKILMSENKFVLGFLDSLVDANSQELAAAAQLEDSMTFYQTTTPDVAKFFHIDPKAKRPTLVLVKKDTDNSYFDGQFTKSSILDFVSANKLPLVNIFTRENAPTIFENPIKKQILLFASSKDSEKVLPPFKEAAKLFKGKLIFVYVEMDNEDIGKPVSDYFGVTGNGPNVLAYSGNEDAKKFMLDGELTVDSIKAFSQGFLEDKLKPFYKSDPIPETNDEDVKIVVGNNFDEIVLDESKDVLLEIYAPWCGHCQALEPTYNKLAKHLRNIDSLVIAKMDGTTNEHPRARSDGFPTIVFFPAGNKSFDPITADTDRTVVALYKFIKKNASIPFKLQKPGSSIKSDNAVETDGSAKNEKTDDASVKDEL